MSAITEKMLRARETRIDVCGHKLTIRRPTQLDIAELSNTKDGFGLRNMLRFVVGWDFKEIDLVPGGTSDQVKFDQDALLIWVEDNEQSWSAIMDGILDAYKSHAAKIEAEAKN